MAAYAIRRTAALALAVLTMSACGLFEPTPLSTERPLALTPQPTPSSASPTPAPTPTPTPAPTPPPEVPSPPPPPALPEIRFVPALPDDDEDDLRRIFEDLVVGTYELGVTPDPQRVEDFYTESCPCFGDFFAYSESLAMKGHTSEGGPPTVDQFRVVGPIEPSDVETWAVEAIQSYGGGRVVDREGNVVQESPPFEARLVAAILVRDDGLWKFGDVRFPEG